MPTEKPRFTITMPDELFSRITEYRFQNRMKNQTQAVIDLIEKGFAAMSAGNPALVDDGHIKKYRTLDRYGKRAVDAVLDIEAERCQRENESRLEVAARAGDRREQEVEAIDFKASIEPETTDI